MRGLLGIVVLAGIAGGVARGLTAAPRSASTPRRFPTHVLPTGDLPALWIFVRAECLHCRRHLNALAAALSQLPTAERTKVAARLHIVGDLQLAAAWQHPRALLDSLEIGITPRTWWVGSDARIQRAWLGARDEGAWRRALSFVQNEGGPP